MGKPKTVITENGAVYQLSDPNALRLVYRIVGVVLILMGAVLTLISPAGVAFAALGVALVFWLPKKIQPVKKFLRFTGTPCAGNCTFGHWDPKVHTGQAQLERFEKAVSGPPQWRPARTLVSRGCASLTCFRLSLIIAVW